MLKIWEYPYLGKTFLYWDGALVAWQACLHDPTDMYAVQWRQNIHSQSLNSLAPGRFEYHSKNIIFNLVLQIGIFRCSHDNALRWMTQDLTDDKSTLVQVMAWCRQATSHYLSQCWLSSVLPYGIANPQWVNVYGWSWDLLRWWSPSSMWTVLQSIFKYHHRGCLNNPTFSNLGGWGLGAFLMQWPPSATWAGPLNLLWPPPGMSK